MTSSKINFGGSGAGIWYEEIGRTTLGSSGNTITVSSFGARKYLKILISAIPTGGTVNVVTQFNSDTAANYAGRGSANGGADGTSTSAANIGWSPTNTLLQFCVIDVMNIAAQEKIAYGLTVSQSVAGATTPPTRNEGVGKWTNTSAQITTIDVKNAGGTGSYAAGSEVIILGHN